MCNSKTVFIFAPDFTERCVSIRKAKQTIGKTIHQEIKMMKQNRLHITFRELSLGRFLEYNDKKLIDALYQKQKPLC